MSQNLYLEKADILHKLDLLSKKYPEIEFNYNTRMSTETLIEMHKKFVHKINLKHIWDILLGVGEIFSVLYPKKLHETLGYRLYQYSKGNGLRTRRVLWEQMVDTMGNTIIRYSNEKHKILSLISVIAMFHDEIRHIQNTQ